MPPGPQSDSGASINFTRARSRVFVTAARCLSGRRPRRRPRPRGTRASASAPSIEVSTCDCWAFVGRATQPSSLVRGGRAPSGRAWGCAEAARPAARRPRADSGVRALERAHRGTREEVERDHRRDRVPGKPEDERAVADAEPRRLSGLEPDAPEALFDAELGERRLDVVVRADRHAAADAHDVGRRERARQRRLRRRRSRRPARSRRSTTSAPARSVCAASAVERSSSVIWPGPRSAPARRARRRSRPSRPAGRARTRPRRCRATRARRPPAGPSSVPASMTMLAGVHVLAGATHVCAGVACGHADLAVALLGRARPERRRACPPAPRRRSRSGRPCPARAARTQGAPARRLTVDSERLRASPSGTAKPSIADASNGGRSCPATASAPRARDRARFRERVRLGASGWTSASTRSPGLVDRDQLGARARAHHDARGAGSQSGRSG